MTTIKNLDLTWEKIVGGAFGVYKVPKKIVFTPTLMKRLAIAKMTDVSLISADFHETPIIFAPRLCLLLDFFSRLEFFGVYDADVSTNEDASDSINELKDLPDFCIRKVWWNKAEDIENFQIADDKEQYILSDKQTLSNVIFIKSTQVPEIPQLISEAIRLARHGLELHEQPRTEPPYYEVNLNVSDGGYRFDFAYAPGLLENSILEEWIIKWRNCIDDLPLDIGYLPDEKFRISYELSLFDQISIFGRIQ